MEPHAVLLAASYYIIHKVGFLASCYLWLPVWLSGKTLVLIIYARHG